MTKDSSGVKPLPARALSDQGVAATAERAADELGGGVTIGGLAVYTGDGACGVAPLTGGAAGRDEARTAIFTDRSHSLGRTRRPKGTSAIAAREPAGDPAALATRDPADISGGTAASEPDDLLLAAENRSMPASVALMTVFWRVARTTGPIVLGDLLALVIAGACAAALIPPLRGGSWGTTDWAQPLTSLALPIAFWIAGLYTEVWVHPAIELRQVVLVSTIVLIGAVCAGGLLGQFPVSCAITLTGAAVLVPVIRALVRRACSGGQWWGYPTLVVSCGDSLEPLVGTLLGARGCALRPILINDPLGGRRSSVLPVANDRTVLESIVRTETIRHAVVSLPDLPARRADEVLCHLGQLVPHVLVLGGTEMGPALWTAGWGGEVCNGLVLAPRRAMKRVIDVTVAGVSLALALPLLAFVAILVKCTSRGPVLFAHPRIGRHGQSFRAWKFRTMRVDGEAVLREHLERVPGAREEWERDQKLQADPRVTWIGHWLRRCSLDELPQLWNVLRGEMSVVGPRPIVEKEVRRYGDTFRLITLVRPGITGLWQVSGRNDLDYCERVALDRFYIRQWSPWLDAYIVARTFVALLSRRGAY